MKEVIADQNYFFDADGDITTDESKGERWLAKEGANVLEEHREALEAFTGDKEGSSAEGEKSEAPKANKKATPSKNKGVK